MSNKLLHIENYFNLLELIRINQPIGIFLLLWPTLWGLWFSNKETPDIGILLIFIFGVLCMRSAGCIINDYIDCEIDRVVSRTKNRPLSTGIIRKKDALIILLVFLVIALLIVSRLNRVTVLLSLIALLLSWIYPYLKRYIYLPQIILGILFSWPILMAFTATNHVINGTACLLFAMNIVWVVIYDTQYAMIDREDDKFIGIKSSAILFGNMDKFVIGCLQFFMVFLLYVLGWKERFSVMFYIFSVFGVIILFIWQQILIHERTATGCFKAFLSNNYVGMLIFVGIVLSVY